MIVWRKLMSVIILCKSKLKDCYIGKGDLMIGTFDIDFEKQLIKDDAKETFENLIYRANSRQLEKDFVFREFLKQFNALAKKNGIL